MSGSPRILDNGLELSAVDELAGHLAPSFIDPDQQEVIAKSPHPEPMTKSQSPGGEQASGNPRTPSNAPTIASEVAVNRQIKHSSPRQHTLTSPKPSRGLFALASRRWRLVATAIAVLLVTGLGVWNWRQKSAAVSNEEQAGLDLADFSEDFSIKPYTSLEIARSDSSDLPKVAWAGIADRQPRQLERDFPSREPPAGRVQPVGHSVAASGTSTNTNVSSTGIQGPRGAWLTGQIEFESGSLPLVDQRPKSTTTSWSR